MIKASDFRAVFGRVNQNSPVFSHSMHYRNAPIRGANADGLKFSPSICRYCNNTRTQAHDRAWEKLSAAIREHQPPLRRGSLLPHAKAFQGPSRAEMRNVHLYFLKLFGCYVVEHSVPLPLTGLAISILGEVPHPNFYLDFVAVPSNAGKAKVIVGNINAINQGTRIVAATWFYMVGVAGVHLTFYEPGHPRPAHRLGWNPDDLEVAPRMR